MSTLTTSDSYDITFIITCSIHHGLPFIILSSILLLAMSNFRYNLTYLKLWIVSYTERYRFGISMYLPNIENYNNVLIYWRNVAETTGRQVNDELNRNKALEIFIKNSLPWIAVAFWGLLFSATILELIVWAVMLIIYASPIKLGFSILFIPPCIMALIYGGMFWKENLWHMTYITKISFLIGGLLYIATTLVIIFTSISIEFFGLSVVFVTFNFICVMELLVRNEDADRTDPEEYFGTEKLTQLTLNAVSLFRGDKSKENLSCFSTKETVIPIKPPKTPKGGKKKKGQVEITKSPEEIEFDEQVDKVRKENLESRALTYSNNFKYWYGLSIVILVAYAIIVQLLAYKFNAISNLGWLVMAAIILLDTLSYLFSSLGNSMNGLTRTIMFAGCRLCLISFGFQNWLMGFCLVYICYGVFFAYSLVDFYMPYPPIPPGGIAGTDAGEISNRTNFKLSSFLVDDDELKDVTDELTQALLKAKDNLSFLGQFAPIIILTLGFTASIIASYATNSSPLTFASPETPQYLVGVASILAVIMCALMFTLYRYVSLSKFKIVPGMFPNLFLAQIALAIGGVILYFILKSTMVLALVIFLPPLGFIFINFYKLQQATDFAFIQSSEFRDPPYSSFCFAFWACGLAFEDYKYVVLIVSMFFYLILLGVVIAFTYSGIVGLAFPLYIFVTMGLVFPALKYFQTLQFEQGDWGSIAASLLIHFGFMVGLYYYELSIGNLTTILTAILFGASIAFPFVILLATALYKLFDDRGVISSYVENVFKLIIVIVCGVGAVVIYYYPWYIGAAVITLFAFITLTGWTVFTWIKNYYQFTPLIQGLGLFIGLLCILFGVGVGIALSPFGGFTVSWFVIVVLTLVYSYGLYVQGASGGSGAPNPTPLLFSPYVFPVYRFNVLSNDIEDANPTVFSLYVAFFMVFIWAVCAAVLYPDVGLGIGCLVVVVSFSFSRYAMSAIAQQFSDVVQYIKFDMVKMAQKQAIDLQMSSNSGLIAESGLDDPNYDGEISFDAIQNKRDTLIIRYQLMNLTPDPNDVIDYTTIEYQIMKVKFYDAQLDTLNIIQQRFIGHFTFLLILATRASLMNDEAAFLSFVRWIKERHPTDELSSVLTEDEVKGWTSEMKKRYRELKSQYFEKLKFDEEISRLHRAEEERKAKEREEQMASKVFQTPEEIKEKFEYELENCQKEDKKYCDPDFSANDKSLYVEGFRDPTCGSTMHMVPITGWARPSEYCDEEPILTENGFDINQIKQGKIGDCYFISAISVAANKKEKIVDANGVEKFSDNRVMQAMIQPAEYNPHGIYMVTLYKGGKEIPVIVDDLLPVWDGSGETEPGRTKNPLAPCFVRSRNIREIWASIVEKAYAKLHNSFQIIEAGKVHHALVDLTNGASEELRMDSKEVKANLDSMWEKIYSFHEAGYLLACGSNSGEDSHIVDGIAMGHAYGITQMFVENDLKLIRLRNPWGELEWTGDWCDSSPLWTKRLISKLGVTVTNDGTFWMAFTDFAKFFANVFVCRMTNRPPVTIRSKWRGPSAVGVIKPTNNPQFIMTISNPQTVYLVLQQDDQRGKKTSAQVLKEEIAKDQVDENGNPLQDEEQVEENEDEEQSEDAPKKKDNGFKFIMFYLMDNNGERVQDITKSKDKTLASGNKGKFLNDREISAEVALRHAGSYTICCTTRYPGEEIGFLLSVFANEDVELTLIPFEKSIQKELNELEQQDKESEASNIAQIEEIRKNRRERLKAAEEEDEKE